MLHRCILHLHVCQLRYVDVFMVGIKLIPYPEHNVPRGTIVCFIGGEQVFRDKFDRIGRTGFTIRLGHSSYGLWCGGDGYKMYLPCPASSFHSNMLFGW